MQLQYAIKENSNQHKLSQLKSVQSTPKVINYKQQAPQIDDNQKVKNRFVIQKKLDTLIQNFNQKTEIKRYESEKNKLQYQIWRSTTDKDVPQIPLASNAYFQTIQPSYQFNNMKALQVKTENIEPIYSKQSFGLVSPVNVKNLFSSSLNVASLGKGKSKKYNALLLEQSSVNEFKRLSECI